MATSSRSSPVPTPRSSLSPVAYGMTHSGLRSGDSDEPSLTAIINATSRTIDLIWLDYVGSEVSYGPLAKKKHFGAKTYVGHPWIFYVKGTRLRLNVCLPGQPPTDVLWPQKVPPSGKAKYNVAIVTYPVLSLRDACMQALRDFGVTDEVMRQQCIPDSLTRDYHSFCQHS